MPKWNLRNNKKKNRKREREREINFVKEWLKIQIFERFRKSYKQVNLIFCEK